MVQSCKFQRVIEIHLYIAVGTLLPSPGHPHLRMAQKDFTQAQRRIVARWSVTPTSQASEGQRHEPFHETVGLSPMPRSPQATLRLPLTYVVASQLLLTF